MRWGIDYEILATDSHGLSRTRGGVIGMWIFVLGLGFGFFGVYEYLIVDFCGLAWICGGG